MKHQIAFPEEPGRWPLKRALKEKAGWTDAQIAELEISADEWDRLELLMQVEEEFGIEIQDDDPPS